MVEISFNQAKKKTRELKSIVIVVRLRVPNKQWIKKNANNRQIQKYLYLLTSLSLPPFAIRSTHILHYSEDRPKFIAAMVDILVVAS